MIAAMLKAFADRVCETALPVNVIAAEARDLAATVENMEAAHTKTFEDAIAEREKELAAKDATIAELRSQLGTAAPGPAAPADNG